MLDLDRVDGDLTVRPATGTESYRTFGGELEQPRPDEIIYADLSRGWATPRIARELTAHRPDMPIPETGWSATTPR